MDRTISRSSEAWLIEVTNDDGEHWMSKPLIFDDTDVTPMSSFDSPYYGESFRFRIRFTDKRGYGSNWRILIDNIFVTQGENIEVPWYIQPGRIFDGFETSQDSISFTPLMSGSTFFAVLTWIFGGALCHIAEDAVCGKVPLLYPTQKVGIRLFTVGSFREYLFASFCIIIVYAMQYFLCM